MTRCPSQRAQRFAFCATTTLLATAAWTDLAIAAPSPHGHRKPLTPKDRHVPAQPASRLEEITVTAERRQADPQKIGTSLSIVSARELAARNVNDVFDLQYLTPSLQMTPQFGSGQPDFELRGIGHQDYGSSNVSPVGIYINEVSNPVTWATNGLIFDVSRVEVLRGPQGTLYGRNTTAGAINFVVNQPTDSFHAGADVQFGAFSATKYDGYLSGPVARGVTMRLAGESQQGGAWQYDGQGAHLGNVNRTALRWLTDLRLSDTLKAQIDLHGSIDRSDAAGLHLFSPLTTIAATNPGGPVLPQDHDRDITHWGTSAAFAKLIGVTPDQKPYHHIDTGGANIRLDQSLPFATLTNLASYNVADRHEYDNFDGTSLNVADVAFKSRANVFQNELRLVSRGDHRLNWIVGLYYANEYLADQYFSGFLDTYHLMQGVFYSEKVNTLSGFGQATYRIRSNLSLTGGLRVEHEARDLHDFRAYSFAPDGGVLNPSNAIAKRSLVYTLPSWKVQLQYTPTRNDMLYASVSRGINSGGFTTYNTSNAHAASAPYQPEKLLAYEIGNKLDIPEAHLRLNVAAFYYDYHDQQVLSAVVNAQTGLIGAIVNAPRSHLAGGEFEIDWSPLDGLTLRQSGSWAIGQFDRFNAVYSAEKVGNSYQAVYQSRRGVALPAPKLTFNGSATYRWQMGRYDASLGINYSLRTTYYSLFGPMYNVAGYTLWGLTASIAPRKGWWSFNAFGNNIFDRQYDVTRNFFLSGDNIALAGMPATWGLRFAAKY
ncbi:TonB-dependent receptor [Acidomonas methanolica]|uniref:TonB-dependent receptor n=1 Tax=Acidomonas methanolica TaxID=437 RepID=UPI002119E493|nr:TonB-dependent receptor [Acidomonas methanolica]MCQ9155914.1 TonB-dependent receptor [Acidomonas methanolica]